MEEKKLQHAQDVYRENQIRTASREQLLIITYDIGIGACKAAEEAIEKNDMEAKNLSLQRAQRVLRELMVTLNPQHEKDLADNLTSLYEFLLYELVQSNVSNEVAQIQGVREMLMELRNTWIEALEKLCAQEETLSGESGKSLVEAGMPGGAYDSSPKKGGFSVAG